MSSAAAGVEVLRMCRDLYGMPDDQAEEMVELCAALDLGDYDGRLANAQYEPGEAGALEIEQTLCKPAEELGVAIGKAGEDLWRAGIAQRHTADFDPAGRHRSFAQRLAARGLSAVDLCRESDLRTCAAAIIPGRRAETFPHYLGDLVIDRARELILETLARRKLPGA